ncbi:uncharacterized protein LOC103702647 [Phoenix dactylifera]|uniref:Uncharacterized protein LOC103702647 n=1 Tax=Phoenix dactylifera TaxID=42345 RepID=A0A8B9ABM2_PHODC|nr:uncharacterized protein LOC103702647 [Phoenix dactylifera]XP_038983127.1 uncharacterized protein LOC103702647 [Phoenix dactylifera]XP_038983128.1 uncharacterized protein LOC103702647 [Phoenix dactylifera]XP_038983129.1 uncharacterized protein LOC103702647 [Phoenix dactylifera]
MKRAPVFPKNEIADCNELGYDAQLDFSKILGEERKHANDAKFSLSPSNSEEKKVEVEATKNKKSWKRSLFFWFKLGKKSSKQSGTFKTNSSNCSHVPNHKHGPVSGPLFGNGGNLALIQRSIRRSTSGPLAHCFTPTKAEENEVPYLRLAQQSHPSAVQAFGPIYLVT